MAERRGHAPLDPERTRAPAKVQAPLAVLEARGIMTTAELRHISVSTLKGLLYGALKAEFQWLKGVETEGSGPVVFVNLIGSNFPVGPYSPDLPVAEPTKPAPA